MQKPEWFFKEQFIVCKGKPQKKSGQFLQEELGWLICLINKVLSYNMGFSGHALMLIPRF
jgi:hypothetical protein